MDRSLTRRQALGSAGAAGVALAGARAGLPRIFSGLGPGTAAAATAGCATLTPELTEGPYWLDLMQHRSNVIANTSAVPVSPGVKQSGVPLELTIDVLNAQGGCSPLNGAYVDIWHANAHGVYSDEASQQAGGGTSTADSNTAGQDFLRGYQITGTDSGVDGRVVFETIWPGWYASRAIHIHVRVRAYTNDTVVTNYTTQIFFPDSQNDAVFAAAPPYSARTPVDDPTTNETDTVLRSADDATNIVSATGSVANGYKATFTITLDSSSTSTPLSTTVESKLKAVSVVRTAHGGRSVVASLETDGTVSVNAEIVRGTDHLGTARGRLHAGTHKLKVHVARGAAAGPATLVLKITDASRHTKTIRRHIHIPVVA
jgi:protocatechuate 3,4-dioxygenase beta subunit